MNIGTCRLCELKAQLCESHALPQSQFNFIMRKSAGKAVVITDDQATPVQYSSDSWAVCLLCASCETKLNRNYDDYGVGVFRGRIAKVHREPTGITLLNVDRNRLRMFFLSLLWRISISSHESYSNIDLPFGWENELQEALQQSRQIPNSHFTVRVRRLHDSTGKRGFSQEDLRAFIAAPFARRYEHSICVCYPFLGFFVETFLPRLPKRLNTLPGILTGTGRVFFAPHVDVFQVPELVSLFVQGLRKHDSGLSNVS